MKKVIILALLFSYSFASIEDRVKSQFVGKISSLIKWSKDKQKDEFLVGVYGKTDVSDELKKMYTKKKIKKKKVVIKNSDNIEELKDVNVIYIGSASHDEILKVVDFAKKNSILTISDAKGFVDKNGIIQLFTISRKMNIKVNNTIAKESKLEIKPILLKLAKDVK